MKTLLHYFFASLLAVSILAAHASGTSNGIDPSDADEQYAWSEGVGWINFEVTSLVGSPDEVIVSDTSMVGHAWSQTTGWINLTPTNGGVTNTCDGTLGGYAWGEGVGWIDFSGVTIDEDGYFRGRATGDTTGDIVFDCRDTGDGCSDVSFSVRTSWRPTCGSLGLGGGGSSGSSGSSKNSDDTSDEHEQENSQTSPQDEHSDDSDENSAVEESQSEDEEQGDAETGETQEENSCQEPYLYDQSYRSCEKGEDIDTFFGFADNVACEGFIVYQDNPIDYDFKQPIPRKEMAGMAYKMLRVRDISTSTYSHVFLDIGTLGQPAWIQKAVETNLAHQVITPNREFFYPDAQVTRAESFAMIMAAVCLYPTGASGQDWQKKLYDVAFANGLTVRGWEAFDPDGILLRQEAFALSSRAADWADEHGGCAKLKPMCG